MPYIIGEYVDRLCTVEMRFREGLPRGVTHRLYAAARAHQGEPLTSLAARRLREQVQAEDRVLVVTGAGAPPGLPQGETDGPLGAAALVRALDIGVGAKPILVTEERNAPPIVAAVQAAGVTIVEEEWFGERPHAALLEIFPAGLEAGRQKAAELFERFAPKAIIFVEKAGPNDQMMYHSILGTGRSPDIMANVFCLVDIAQERNILTIGIGDGGNEIGFGKIREEAQEIQPYGKVCRCPCQGGVITTTATEVLVVAAISNWGAYGVVANLAFQLGNVEIIQPPEVELFMLQACVMAGGHDGVYASQTLYVDGTSAAVQQALVTMLRMLVDNGLKKVERRF